MILSFLLSLYSFFFFFGGEYLAPGNLAPRARSAILSITIEFSSAVSRNNIKWPFPLVFFSIFYHCERALGG